MTFITGKFAVRPAVADAWPELSRPRQLVATPRIVSVAVEQDDWSELGEMRVD